MKNTNSLFQWVILAGMTCGTLQSTDFMTHPPELSAAVCLSVATYTCASAVLAYVVKRILDYLIDTCKKKWKKTKNNSSRVSRNG